MLSSEVLLAILLALPFVAAVVVAVLGSRHAMLGLFGAPHELAAVLGSHEAVEALQARSRQRQGHVVRWVTLLTTFVVLALTIYLTVGVAKPRIQAHGDTVADQSLPTLRANLVNLTENSAIQFYLHLDGMNVWLIVLTAVLMVSSVLVSWTAISERTNEFYAWLLILEGACLGVFLSFDIVLFYVFFELTLVPLFFLIGIWGGEERQYAARKFFIYTFGGSLITLVGLIGVVLVIVRPPVKHALGDESNIPPYRMTFAIPELVDAVAERSQFLTKDIADTRTLWEDHAKKLKDAQKNATSAGTDEIRKQAEARVATAENDEKGTRKRLNDAEDQQRSWRNIQYLLFAAMMVGFAVKVPLFPVHTWLPLAHVQAPTAGSVLLAGVLLKLGTYGFLRLCLPLAPDAALVFGAPLLGALAVVGILYGSFCALAQDDMKKLVAYSSVAHLGFCVLGLFALNELGLQGALLQMINHGLSTGALFLLVGMLYERYHTRKLADYGGMAAKLKLLAAFMVFITMSSVGLPGLNGFVGEYFVLSGMFGSADPWINGRALAVLSSFGVVLGAWYMLSLLRGVYFGEVKEPHHGHAAPGHDHASPVKDLNGRELVALVPIAALCVLLGVFPQPFLDTSKKEINEVARTLQVARGRRSPATETAAAATPAEPAQARATQAPVNPGE